VDRNDDHFRYLRRDLTEEGRRQVQSSLMPSAEDVIGWILTLLIIGVLGLAVWHGLNPKNPLSRGLEAFWNTPAIKRFRMFIWKAFWVCFLGFLGISFIS
jgi:hypothetical protein